MPRVHVHISGKVQGVYYRDTCKRRADRLGLSGWVRNLADGRVEAVFQGPRPHLQEMLAWCHQGPPEARVTAVSDAWGEAEEPLRGFEIRRTGA